MQTTTAHFYHYKEQDQHLMLLLHSRKLHQHFISIKKQ